MNKKQIGYRVGLSVFVLGFVLISFIKISTVNPNEKTVTSTGVNEIEMIESKGIQKSSTKSDDKKPEHADQNVVSKTSPKQAEIKAKVTNEKRYYLLSDPNDTLYQNDWALNAVQAPTAWNTSVDSSSVKVAVLDTGFALSHQDLTDRWYTNSAEMGVTANEGAAPNCTSRSLTLDKSCNNLDDDGNGYIDDWRGWDFYNADNNPQTGLTDPNGSGVAHGTEVAGLVGATTGNGLGVASIARNPTILPLEVMSDAGSGYSSDIAAAIYYSTDQGADIINMSLGTSGDDPAVRDAVDYAISHNVVVIAAAGNCGDNFEGVCAGQPAGIITFPASYDRVVAVGATDENNQRASFSSYDQRLDVMAPGSGSIYSTAWIPSNGISVYVTSLYGTSFASPLTASAAALIRSIRPSSSVDDVRALLMASSQKVSGMAGVFYTTNYGHGLLDVGKSLQVASDLNGITETKPIVYQAGNYKANSQYLSTDSLGSGCEVASGTWCTVWLRNTSESYDRYLPYEKTDINNSYGWTWSAAVMQHGEWEVRARQGDQVTVQPTILFSK